MAESRCWKSWLLVVVLAGTTTAEELPGPMPTWADAKRDFGAVGDGKSDDTQALQSALNALKNTDGKTTSLFLPAGTYRITRTLVLPRKTGREAIGLNLQGESPENTVLRWDGPADGVLFDYGAWYSKLGRMTFDGAGKAKTALRHGPEFVTANELADLVFRDVGFGIEAGDPARAGIAETAVLRCKFLRCSKAGVSIQNFNSLDWWLWYCRFEDCLVGATNTFGAGNFHVYESVFLRSRDADITIGNTGYFSFRNNVSIGSKAFFVASGIGAGAQLTFQDNWIQDTRDAAAVRVGNLGPVFLLGNTFAGRAGAEGPLAVGPNAHVIAAGNRFTVPKPLQFKAGSIEVENSIVNRSNLQTPSLNLPATPLLVKRTMIALQPKANAAAIQKAIDAAAQQKGQRPIVFFPAGQYAIDRTLVVPAGCDVQLVGEGIPYNTQLQWTGEGTGPVLCLASPSRATVRDMALVGSKRADGIALDDCDQPGGRVFLDQVQADGATQAGYFVNGVERAQIQFRDCGHSGSAIGVKVVGGARQQRNEATEGRMIYLSGASSNNDLSYEVADGGKLVVRDIWYETGEKPRFLHLTGRGEFTLQNANVAHPRKRDEPGVVINGFRGRVSLLGVCFTQVGGDKGTPALVVKGTSPETQVLALGCHGNGEYMARSSPGVRAGRLCSVQYTEGGGAKTIADVGERDPRFVLEMLKPTCDVRASRLEDLPPGVTDVRLHRVFLSNVRNGIELKAGK